MELFERRIISELKSSGMNAVPIRRFRNKLMFMRVRTPEANRMMREMQDKQLILIKKKMVIIK